MPLVAGTQYAQIADLTVLGLTSGAITNVSTNDKNAALLVASGKCDSYFSAQYPVPLANWGSDVVRAVCIVAAYDLLVSRGGGLKGSSDDNIRERYLLELKWLEAIRDGDQDLAVDPTPSAPASAGQFSMRSSTPRGFTHRGFEDS